MLDLVCRASFLDPPQGQAQIPVVVQRGADQLLQRWIGEIVVPRKGRCDMALGALRRV